MPNPLIKWARQNTHPEPPHPSGAIKVDAISEFSAFYQNVEHHSVAF